MNRRLRVNLFLFQLFISALFFLTFPTHLWATPSQVMPIDSIKPGMKGVGKSVFSGTKVEEFEVEVLDVMRQVSPHRDLILCRLSGAGLEKTGVIAGMSGSPVYINNKLAGAIASTWSFTKEPIAGVTPAGEMLTIWNQQKKSAGDKRQGVIGTGLKANLPVPLTISGFNPLLNEIIAPALSGYNFKLVGTTGSGLSDSSTANLIPGGVIGVGLIDGDVRLAAVGTITHREGDKILAFGHPLFLAGDVALPMTGGVIHSVLPSLDLSFKIFSPGPPIGVITQDREVGVSGTIGPIPPMVPVSVSVRSSNQQETYRFRVARQELLTPLLISIGLADIALQPVGTMAEITLHSQVKIVVDESTQTTIRHTIPGPNPVARFFEKTQSELKLLFENPFQPVEEVEIVAEFTVTSGKKTAQLLSAQPSRSSIKPGETLSVRLRLRDYRAGEFEKEVLIPIPITTPPGSLSINISSKEDFLNSEMNRAPATLTPTSFSSLLKILKEVGEEEEIIIAGYVPAGGIVLSDKELPQPPPFLRAALAPGKTGTLVQTAASSLLFKIPVNVERVVSGSTNIEIKVE